MSTFGERIRDSLIVSGLGSIQELAVKTRLPDIVLRRALATQGESLSWRQGVTICRALHVRSRWLLDGEGPVAPVVTGDKDEATILIAWSALPPERQRIFLALVSKMLQ